MYRSNKGANTNTLHMMADVGLLVLVLFADVLLYGCHLSKGELSGMIVLACVFGGIILLANKQAYLYNITLFFYIDRVLVKVFKSFFIATMATVFILPYMTEQQETKMFFYLFIVVSFVLMIIKVFFHKKIMHLLQSKSAPRTVLVGKKEQFEKFWYFLNKTSIRLVDVGYIAMNRADYEVAEDGEYIGCLDELEELIRKYNIDQVYIIQQHDNEILFTQQYVDVCIDMGVTVRLVVDFYKESYADSYVSTVGTYPVIAYHTITLNTYEMMLKRMIDIIGGFIGVVLSSPIMLVTAIAIKLEDPKGPVLFKQIRVGRNGRQFKIYKFRSMYTDAEERKKDLMSQNEIDGGVMFKMKDDPRITKVGKVIRKLSIDELPQFFNVLEGSMSLVGTRPPTLDEVEKYKRKHWRRISIKPGITGMWQVNGRSNILDFDTIVDMDVEYIDEWSLWMDFKIIIKTVLVLLKHDDAY